MQVGSLDALLQPLSSFLSVNFASVPRMLTSLIVSASHEHELMLNLSTYSIVLPLPLQTTARRNDWPLDKTVIITEATKKRVEEIDQPSKDGAYIHGLTLEGARWDDKLGLLDDSKPKELFCPMPVILVRAVPVDKSDLKDVYQVRKHCVRWPEQEAVWGGA